MTDTLTHHELTAEWIDDNQGRSIMLTQPSDNYDEPVALLVHPWQLRAVCENFGLVAGDATTQKTIATLSRRLLLLNSRIKHLDNWLLTLSDSKHADLNYEIGYSSGTADMASEFCADLLDVAHEEASAPAAKPTATKPTQQVSLI
jgi:hypothetical protein